MLGPDAVSVTWQVTTEPGATAACAVQALNESFAIVGWKVLELPAGDVPHPYRSRIEVLHLGAGRGPGSVYRCWLTSSLLGP